MNILKKILGGDSNKNMKEQFFAGWEVTFDGSDDGEKFMQTQGVDEKTAMSVWASIKLTFQNGTLLKAEDIRDGKIKPREIAENEMSLPYHEVPVHPLFEFIPGAAGIHQLGGEVPEEFILPAHNLVTSFQYIGFIDNRDNAFSWLPFKVHLICPIYLNFEKVFLDYSNPFSPVLMNADELSDADSSFDELSGDSIIVYDSVKFNTVRSSVYGNGIGHTGVPGWIQAPGIPRCPKTNRIMKFLCQLNRQANVPAKYHNVIPEESYHLQYFEKMNFWMDGDLYIFFEPESKTCCYIIQNT